MRIGKQFRTTPVLVQATGPVAFTKLGNKRGGLSLGKNNNNNNNHPWVFDILKVLKRQASKQR